VVDPTMLTTKQRLQTIYTTKFFNPYLGHLNDSCKVRNRSSIRFSYLGFRFSPGCESFKINPAKAAKLGV